MARSDDIATQSMRQRNPEGDYIRSAMRHPLLERSNEHDLALAWRNQGDQKAMHQLVRSHARLVVALAQKFRHYGLPLADLIQEGNIGLMLAASRFDADREVRFSTYATWWVRSTIQDFILRNWSIVRTGTTAAQKSLFFNLRRLRTLIESRTGQSGLNDAARYEIATTLSVEYKDVIDMEQRLSFGDQSLNAVLSVDSEDAWQDFLVDERPNPEDVVIGMKDSATRSRWLAQALGTLSDRERNIIAQRRLVDEPVTLEEIGKDLGVSKERVRQLEARAMDKLKGVLLDKTSNIRDFIG